MPASVPSRSPRPSGMSSCRSLANHLPGSAYHALGDYRRAMDCFGQTVASLEGERRHERFGMAVLPAVLSRAWLASCLPSWGRSPRAVPSGKKRLRIAEAVDHPCSLIRAYCGVGLLSLRQGRPATRPSPCSNGPGPLSGRGHPALCSPWSPRGLGVRRIPWPGASPRPCRCWSRRWSRRLQRT